MIHEAFVFEHSTRHSTVFWLYFVACHMHGGMLSRHKYDKRIDIKFGMLCFNVLCSSRFASLTRGQYAMLKL